MTPINVTITGIDVRTNYLELPQGPEYGFLLSMSRLRNPDQHRYMMLHTVHQILCDMPHYTTALHICGKELSLLLAEKSHKLSYLTSKVDRIQINGTHLSDDQFHDVIYNTKRRYEIITQFSAASDQPYSSFPCNHMLFDASGGRGEKPDQWLLPSSRHVNKRYHGFAGGLNPNNIKEEIQKMCHISDGLPFWVDVESGVRNVEDYLSLTQVELFLKNLEVGIHLYNVNHNGDYALAWR